MKTSQETKAQLLAQTEVLRQRVAELEAADAKCRQTQAALQVSETRYRRLFETTQDGILVLDADTGQITDKDAGVFARRVVGPTTLGDRPVQRHRGGYTAQ